MQIKTKPMKLALGAAIITLILIGFYAFNEQDANQGQTTSSGLSEQLETYAKDPFKEHLEKQQQGASIQASSPQSNRPIQIVSGNSTTAVPVGTDPFKAFLDTQEKSQKETSATSPFGGGK